MKRILIAAGGTGGHIYPGLAIASALKHTDPEIQVEFVGTIHGLENRIVPAQGYKVHHLSIGRLNSNVPLAERLKTLALLPWSLVQSLRLLRRVRPDLVIGVGGHASGPLLLMASLLGCRTAIWEPNAMPGLANRWLSRFVDGCWVVFDEAKPRLKSSRFHSAGMPVRREIEELAEKTPPAQAPSGPFRVLVFGGSQGARGINRAVLEMVQAANENWLKQVAIVHQTGRVEFAAIKEAYGSRPVDVREYLYDMGEQYAKADLVVCRAGMGTISELAACAKPAILIPFPFASDDHQRKNAESLMNQGAALMILQKDLTSDGLKRAIDDLRAHPERLREMGEKIRRFHRPRAAETLAKEFLERMTDHAAR
jgi:UDP-N-acetylglucosamine--N-acetylmuramyl-(pentapeptide) pyrophosphoryl-undecaprenol N-acetylglucosamine transferase